MRRGETAREGETSLSHPLSLFQEASLKAYKHMLRAPLTSVNMTEVKHMLKCIPKHLSALYNWKLSGSYKSVTEHIQSTSKTLFIFKVMVLTGSAKSYTH